MKTKFQLGEICFAVLEDISKKKDSIKLFKIQSITIDSNGIKYYGNFGYGVKEENLISIRNINNEIKKLIKQFDA